jgi:hypothetical protein
MISPGMAVVITAAGLSLIYLEWLGHGNSLGISLQVLVGLLAVMILTDIYS